MEDTKSFSHFLTNVCAIIGGVFTVSFSCTSRSHFILYGHFFIFILPPRSLPTNAVVYFHILQVAGIMDSIFHNTMRLVKKVELGKNF